MPQATVIRGQVDMFASTLNAKSSPDYAKEACIWVRDNRTRFERYLTALLELAKFEPYINRGSAYFVAKSLDMDVSLYQELRHDNNMWAALSRYAIMLHPKLIRHIKPKHSGLDTVDLDYMWRSIVDRETIFEVTSWQHAEKWCEVHA